MLKLLGRWMLFFSSYIPLYILLIIKDFNFYDLSKNLNLHNWVLLGFIVVSSLSAMLLLSNKGTEPIIISSIETNKTEVLSYYITYLIPMLTFDPSKINSIIITLIVFITIGVLYTNNNLLHWNPALSLIGYRLFIINKNITVMTRYPEYELRNTINTTKNVIGVQISPNMYVIRKIMDEANK